MNGLTWGELAKIYHEATGRHGTTLPMDIIFEWAENQADKFFVDSEGALHLVPQADPEEADYDETIADFLQGARLP